MAWLVPFADLSDRQQQAVTLDPGQPRFVVGPPGSGKTQILLHRAAWLRDTWHVGAERYRIFVFTNALKDYIRAACEDLAIPLDCVSTFDSWCSDYHQRHLGKLPWDGAAKRPDFPAIRAAALAHARTLEGPLLDLALVDEGQDLDRPAFELLQQVARHVTVCADYKQQIYEHGSTEGDIARYLGLRRSNMTLLEAHRCSPYLVPLAASFVADPAERESFVRQTRTQGGARETPVLSLANDFEAERVQLVAAVRSRLAMGERVAILLPRNDQVYGFQQGLAEAGLDAEVPAQPWRKKGHALDFASDRPKLLTYHSAKGLTFDSVLLPRLVGSSFKRLSTAEIEHLLFVGVTRAVRWAYLSAVRGAALAELGRVERLAREGLVMLRAGSASGDGRASAAMQPRSAEPVTAPAGIEDLF